MTDFDGETPPSLDAMVERIRRSAGELSAVQLDEAIAVATAKRNVRGKYGHDLATAKWNDLVIALTEVREMRRDAAREIEKLVGP